MEAIINERATKHFIQVNWIAFPLWLLWILFDYWYAGDEFYAFLITRISGALFSLLMLLLIRSKKVNIFYLHILFFAYYNAIFSYHVSAVPPPSLQAYLNGYIILMILMFFMLILRFRETLIFSSLVLISIPFVILLGVNDALTYFSNGGFVLLAILAVLVFFGYFRYLGVLRDISLSSEIEKAKAAIEKNEYLERSNREKEVLLQEIHHRVKNNLQIISSILNLQRNLVTKDNIDSFTADFRNRIKSISSIHENLYQSKSLDSINISTYLEEIVREIVVSHEEKGNEIELEFDMQNVELTVDEAMPCGLIVNELVTNSIKHGLCNKPLKIIRINVFLDGELVTISVADNGKGLPENFDYAAHSSLGMTLITTLSEQLDTEVEFTYYNGLTASFSFLRAKPKVRG